MKYMQKVIKEFKIPSIFPDGRIEKCCHGEKDKSEK